MCYPFPDEMYRMKIDVLKGNKGWITPTECYLIPLSKIKLASAVTKFGNRPVNIPYKVHLQFFLFFFGMHFKYSKRKQSWWEVL